MVQQPSNPPVLPTELDGQIIPLQIREAVCGPAEAPAYSTHAPSTAAPGRVRTRAIRQVAVIAVAGRLSDVVADLDEAIQLALADGPRGVVCDMSHGPKGADPIAFGVLATAGRHVRDWPGTPIAVACPEAAAREAVRAHPLGGHLILTGTLFSAVSEVLATPIIVVERLHLAPHPTAHRASRDFITRTLLDWGLGRVIPFASLVVSELVANSSLNAGTDVDVSIAWDTGSLRLTVRDHGPGLPGRSSKALELRGRRLAVVAGLSRSFGVLPTADGGKVVWAVLEATRPRLSTRRIRSGTAAVSQNSPVFTDGRGMADLPFCAGSSPRPTGDPIRPSRGGDHTLTR